MDDSRDDAARERLLAGARVFLCPVGPDRLEVILAEIAHDLDVAGPAALAALRRQIALDIGWGYYPPDPLAQSLHHLAEDQFVTTDSEFVGAEHLAHATGVPLAICANHLSYGDANVLDVQLRRQGGPGLDIARRLTALAGPKVFTSTQRRFSSLCFGTIKVPQSAGVSSEEAIQSARHVAHAARRAIDVARERLRAGDVLLLFGEGTRSRTCGLQPMLAAAARYLDMPGTVILPVGVAGSEVFFPIGSPSIHPARVRVAVGAPIQGDRLFEAAGGDRKLVMDAIGLAIATELPPRYRGVYGHPEEFTAARDILRALGRTP